MNETKGKNKVICILGMHRSGTSMISRVLNLCGLYLGEKPDLFISENPGNKLGHWEHFGILNINKEILRRFGGSWDNPPLLTEGWENDARLDDLVLSAKKIVRDMNSKNKIWGFKEPRTCVTLPFWKKIIPNIIFIIVVRDQMEVAMSLQKRNDMPIDQGLLLWARYWLYIIKNTEKDSKCFTFQENYFKGFEKELSKVLTFINVPGVEYSKDNKEIKEFITPSLVNNVSGRENALKKNEVAINNDILTLLQSFHEELTYGLRRAQIENYTSLINKKKELDDVRRQIEFVKSSKFWKSREIYMKIRSLFK